MQVKTYRGMIGCADSEASAMERGIEVMGPIAPAQQAAVEALLAQRALAPRQRERLEMVKAAWLGARCGRDRAAGADARRARCAAGWRRSATAGWTRLAGAPIPGGRPRPMPPTWPRWRRPWRLHRGRLGLPFDVWSSAAAQCLPGRADRHPRRAGLAAGAAAPAALRLRPAQTHPGASARPRRSHRL